MKKLTCEQSLAALASRPVHELVGNTAVALHTAECPECARVAQVVIDRERSLALAVDGQTFSEVGMVARPLARRRPLIWQLIFSLGIAAAIITIWIVVGKAVSNTFSRSSLTTRETITIPLKCLTSKQALEVVAPYFHERGDNVYAVGEGVFGVTLRGNPHEIAGATATLAKFDAAPYGSCSVKPAPTAPKSP